MTSFQKDQLYRFSVRTCLEAAGVASGSHTPPLLVPPIPSEHVSSSRVLGIGCQASLHPAGHIVDMDRHGVGLREAEVDLGTGKSTVPGLDAGSMTINSPRAA
jgi:hypothetical protein